MIEPKDGTVDLGRVAILAQTRDAVRVSKGNRTAWLPLSQVHPDSPVFGNREDGALWVSPWFVPRIEWR